MRVYVEGAGLCGPGLDGWSASRPLLSGAAAYQAAPTTIAASDLLPATERRRVGVPVKLALMVGSEAIAGAGRDAAATATVFASSGGDCDNVHHLCESLAAPKREVSPTRFHNSVHNAAAGYWSIATRCRAASTSLCCHDGSFGAGLLEAAVQASADDCAVALIAYDHPYPAPLAAVRPVHSSFGMALVLAPGPTARAFAMLDVEFEARAAAPTRMPDAGFEAVRSGVPAGRSLPLLAALARGSRETVVLECAGGAGLRVQVAPCA
jgi:hypothetical protein